MDKIILSAALFALLLAHTPCSGETIPFSRFSTDSAVNSIPGVEITPTGPFDLPFVQGDWEVLGATDPFFNNSTPSEFYSGIIRFSSPVTKFTLDVMRLNNSGLDNRITLTAMDNGTRIKSKAVDIAPLGDSTQITIAAPAIDQIRWGGEGWVFHPYEVEAGQFYGTTHSVGSRRGGSPSVGGDPSVGGTPSVGSIPPVGSAVPEPGVVSALLAAGTLGLFRRPRR